MERGIVVVPGSRLGPYEPLLCYAWLAARARGAETLHVVWTESRPAEGAAAWVAGQVGLALDAFPVQRPVIVGKSLGSHAATLAADRNLAGIWLTPLLTDQGFVAALRRARSPYMLVGGTADALWDGELARQLTPHVIEIPDADHGLIITGQPLAHSAAVLGRVVTAIEAFLDRDVWPS